MQERTVLGGVSLAAILAGIVASAVSSFKQEYDGPDKTGATAYRALSGGLLGAGIGLAGALMLSMPTKPLR